MDDNDEGLYAGNVPPQYSGTPAPVPRWGSTMSGTTLQRTQMRVAIYNARLNRLRRKAKKKGITGHNLVWPRH
jgi:hypothetical protein